MATSQPSNPNSGNQGPGSSRENLLDAKKTLERLIENSGDYNNLLKSASRELDKMQTSYNKIAARVDSLNKGTLNVKEINKEIRNLAEKEFIAKRKVADLEKGLSDESKKQLDTQKQLSLQLEQARKIADKTQRIDKMREIAGKMRLNNARLVSNVELQHLEYHKKMAQISEEEVKFGKDILEKEKETAKYLGISGNLMKVFADKLGVGEEAYNAMTKAARGTVDETGKLTRPTKWEVLKVGLKSIKKSIKDNLDDPLVKAALVVGTFKMLGKTFDAIGSGAKKAMGAFVDGDGPITKVAGNISGMLKNIPLIGGLLAGVVDSFAMLLDFAVGAKSQIQEMGRQIGLSADESLALSRHYYNFSTASGKAYLNSKEMLKTQIDMNRELGITNKISDANVQTAFELMKFAGVELDTVTKIEQLSRITGKSQSSIAGAVMHQVNNFKKLTGVSFSFQGILKEVANLSGYLGLKLAKYPGEIIKSVVAAKGLGLELKQLDSMADGFLDVESSIQKEMEAQVVTGRDINLNRARELFLNNELVEAGAELVKQLGSSEDFLKMNRVEANLVASAMEMSRDQVADMLKQQEHMAAFGAGSIKELQQKIRLMKEQGQAQEAINKLGSEEAFNKYVTSSATEDLAGFIDKIKQSFAELVANTKLADMVQNFIKFLSEPTNITYILNKIKNVFAFVVGAVGSLMGGIMKAINAFSGSWLGKTLGMGDIHIDENMINTVSGMGDTIRGFDMGNLVGAAPSIGDNAVKAQTAGAGTAAAQSAAQGFSGAQNINNNITLMLDGQPVANVVKQINVQKGKADQQRFIEPYV